MTLPKPSCRDIRKETPLLRHVQNKIAKPTDKRKEHAGKKAVCILMARPKSKAQQSRKWPVELPLWPYSSSYLKHGKVLPGQQLVTEAKEARRNYLLLQEIIAAEDHHQSVE